MKDTDDSAFESHFDAFLQEHKSNLAASSVTSSPHDRDDFIRTEQAAGVSFSLIRMAWRVIELAPEQIDLSLFCFSLLSAQIHYPVNFTMKSPKRKELWLETQILGPVGASTEASIYDVFNARLLPLFRNFIEQQMSWSNIVKPDYTDDKIVKLFRKQVIAQTKKFLQQRRK